MTALFRAKSIDSTVGEDLTFTRERTKTTPSRCAVELAAMAISKSSIKFGKLASLVVCPKGTRRNSDAIQSDNKTFSKPT